MLRWLRRGGQPDATLRSGQLDNSGLEAIVVDIAEREGWKGGRPRNAVEVGTGGGKGSTAALHRALETAGCPFQLVGYEGDPELAALASQHWSDTPAIRVVNEYFMRSEDIETLVKPRIASSDLPAYEPVFAAVATAENFLATPPPSPIDLLFIDSVRYTHVAILRAAQPWLGPETAIVMEDDIPGYGELAIVESEFDLQAVARHELEGHPWPLVEFRIVSDG